MHSKEKVFVTTLVQWSHTIHRPMPWKGIDNPYFIWLSEIIMQQTRVEQGLSYYQKFVKLFPTIHDLAAASSEQVLKNWEGLGYYSRARNMHTTAKYIVQQYGGVFPNTYEQILALKGVGPYTASAIASFAYGLPQAVVDGNVIRVLCRYFGLDAPFDTSKGRNAIHTLALRILPKDDSATYNQAIMDFGATVCKPAQAQCDTCVLSDKCFAYNKDLVAYLPYRANKTKMEDRFFNYLVYRYKNRYYIKKREKDFWKDLYEFALIEDKKLLPVKAVKAILDKEAIAYNPAIVFEDRQQKLSHRHIYARFFAVELTAKPAFPDLIELSKSKLANFAFPKIINLYIENNF